MARTALALMCLAVMCWRTSAFALAPLKAQPCPIIPVHSLRAITSARAQTLGRHGSETSSRGPSKTDGVAQCFCCSRGCSQSADVTHNSMPWLKRKMAVAAAIVSLSVCSPPPSRGGDGASFSSVALGGAVEPRMEPAFIKFEVVSDDSPKIFRVENREAVRRDEKKAKPVQAGVLATAFASTVAVAGAVTLLPANPTLLRGDALRIKAVRLRGRKWLDALAGTAKRLVNWLAATLRLSAKDDQNGAGPTFDGTSLLVREGTIKAFPKAPAASTAPPSAPPSVGKAPETNASALEWPWMLSDLKLPDLKDFQLPDFKASDAELAGEVQQRLIQTAENVQGSLRSSLSLLRKGFTGKAEENVPTDKPRATSASPDEPKDASK